MSSVSHATRTILGARGPHALRRTLFRQVGPHREDLRVRSRLDEVEVAHGDAVLPPVNNPVHPRLAEVPAIHFDAECSSVTALPAPRPGPLRVRHFESGIVGTCLNFLWQDPALLYAFRGDLEGAGLRTTFDLVALDRELRVLASREIANLSSVRLRVGGDLPLNLGYFVMDRAGRVIIVTDDGSVQFVRYDPGPRALVVDVTWNLAADLERALPATTDAAGRVARQRVAQVVPRSQGGYWAMALGDAGVSAYLAWLGDDGRVLDVVVFSGEVIENGMAVDHTGAYVVTDHRLVKLDVDPARDRMVMRWQQPYSRATTRKPGTLSVAGSGSTPTLMGERDDLVVITDNADSRINVLVHHRHTGERLLSIPVFEPGRSANENTVVGYRDSLVVQNWWGSEPYFADMEGLEPGLIRIDVAADRRSHAVRWYNRELASTATIRLSTHTGLLYAATQTKAGVRPEYSMDFIDFATGQRVHRRVLGRGRGYRIAMSPAYVLPGGVLVQPTRDGFVTIA